MSLEFEPIFVRLRAILQKHARRFSVTDHTPKLYCLEARVGRATLQAWRGKVKRRQIPVAWAEIEKPCVSFHLMGLYGNARLCEDMPKDLKARMQGKTCFNFKSHYMDAADPPFVTRFDKKVSHLPG